MAHASRQKTLATLIHGQVKVFIHDSTAYEILLDRMGLPGAVLPGPDSIAVPAVCQVAANARQILSEGLGRCCNTLKDGIFLSRKRLPAKSVKLLEQVNAADSLLRHHTPFSFDTFLADLQVQVDVLGDAGSAMDIGSTAGKDVCDRATSPGKPQQLQPRQPLLPQDRCDDDNFNTDVKDTFDPESADVFHIASGCEFLSRWKLHGWRVASTASRTELVFDYSGPPREIHQHADKVEQAVKRMFLEPLDKPFKVLFSKLDS
jgi:hypothetical protein